MEKKQTLPQKTNAAQEAISGMPESSTAAAENMTASQPMRGKAEKILLAALYVLVLCIAAHSAALWPKWTAVTVTASGRTAETQVKVDTEGLLNLNTASADDFTRFSGIGDKYASDIVAFREQIGGFHFKEELRFVKGIGEKRYDAMKDSVFVPETEQNDCLEK